MRLMTHRRRAPPWWPGNRWAFWGSYPLLPWTNRIPDGVFTFEGVEHHVEVNWIDGTALHGLAADVPWTVDAGPADAEGGTAVDLHCDVHGGPYRARGTQRF